MSFGSSLRFEVKEGGKGGKGIFWQKETPKPSLRKFGYKVKDVRHPIRRPEPEYIEEPNPKPKPSKDFIRRNRSQYRTTKQEDDKENHHGNTAVSARPSSYIKPGTVTLTQEQLNALLETVGKLKGGKGGNLRISIDAEHNRLQMETPKDTADSVLQSSRSDAEGSVDEELRSNNDRENKSSSGYGSGDKSVGGKGVRFDSAQNVEYPRTPDQPPPSIPPPLVPWKHMTVAERKRLQWAREKAAEDELQKQVKSFGDPWGRPGAGAPMQKPDPAADSQFRTKEDATLRDAIDNIQEKYADFLKTSPNTTQKPVSTGTNDKIFGLDSAYADDFHSKGDKRKEIKSDSRRKEKTVSSGVPGLDEDYVNESRFKESNMKEEKYKRDKHLDNKGNSRPKKPDRDPRHQPEKEERDEREAKKRQKEERDRDKHRGRESKGDARDRNENKHRNEEDKREEQFKKDRADDRIKAALSGSETYQPPAAMQSSLFIGQAEPDNSQFLSKKELERKQWLDDLNRQREEQRLQKQREKEKARQGGPDDTWADRFVSETVHNPPQSRPQQHVAAAPYASSTGDNDRAGVLTRLMGGTEQPAMPPAAMRSAMAIGDTAPNLERIEQTQAEEKRQWLEELNKQREEQRDARVRLKDRQTASEETWADRFSQDPRAAATAAARGVSPYNPPAPTAYEEFSSGRVSSAPQPALSGMVEEPKTFIRGQNVQVDPLMRQQLETQRLKHLEYQTAIKAQIEEKERLKREEREHKWRDEVEEERKLQAERDSLKRQLEMEDSKKRQSEEARQRQLEHLKTMMDIEQEKAQEERMKKRLITLQQAGHDVSQLKAHYDAITPRTHPSGGINPASIPGLQPSPRDQQSLYHSSHANPSTSRTSEPGRHSQEISTQPLQHEPYMENRTLTPSRYRHLSQPHSDSSSPLRGFATQTDGDLDLYSRLKKERSAVEIEYHGEPSTRTENLKGGVNVRTKSADRNNPAVKASNKLPVTKQNRPQKQLPLKGQPAKWNYQNRERKAPIKQSEKDPFYEETRQKADERRALRERHLQYLQELNKQVIPSEHHHSASGIQSEDDRFEGGQVTGREGGRDKRTGITNGDVSHRSQSPPVNRSKGRYRPANRSLSPPVPSVRHKTGQNPAQDFETDFDADAHNYNRRGKGKRKMTSVTPTTDERDNINAPTKSTDFFPFTRTTDILDPSKADDPVNLSRENTRIKQARQHYRGNQRPADYGSRLDVYEDRLRQPAPRHKDPILNPSLVKDHPTARQDQILQQLSSLKKSLIQRQRELETCMSPSDFEKQL